jgi:hypothetical protein
MVERRTAAVGSEGFAEPTLSLFTQEYSRAVATLVEEGVLENVVNVQAGVHRDDIVIPDMCRCQAKGELLYGDAMRQRPLDNSKIGMVAARSSGVGGWQQPRKRHTNPRRRGKPKTKKPRMLAKKMGYITIDGVTVIPNNKYPCNWSQAKFDKVFSPVGRDGGQSSPPEFEVVPDTTSGDNFWWHNYGQGQRDLLHQNGGDYISGKQVLLEHHNGHKNVIIETTGLMVDHLGAGTNDYSDDIKTRSLSMGGGMSSMSKSGSKSMMMHQSTQQKSTMMGQSYQRKWPKSRSRTGMRPATMTIMYMKKWFEVMQGGRGTGTKGKGYMMNLFTGPMRMKKMKRHHKKPKKYIDGLFPCPDYV